MILNLLERRTLVLFLLLMGLVLDNGLKEANVFVSVTTEVKVEPRSPPHHDDVIAELLVGDAKVCCRFLRFLFIFDIVH